MSLTKQEIKMFEKGWVSCRMAAAKLACHIITIHRLVYDEKIKPRDVMLVGKTKFVKLEAFVASQSAEVQKAFTLNDWSDVAELPAPPKRRTK